MFCHPPSRISSKNVRKVNHVLNVLPEKSWLFACKSTPRKISPPRTQCLSLDQWRYKYLEEPSQWPRSSPAYAANVGVHVKQTSEQNCKQCELHVSQDFWDRIAILAFCSFSYSWVRISTCAFCLELLAVQPPGWAMGSWLNPQLW